MRSNWMFHCSRQRWNISVKSLNPQNSSHTYDLNFTVERRYWNKIKHWTKTDRRKFESDSCNASNLELVRNFEKKCCVLISSSCISMSSFGSLLSSLLLLDELSRCSSNLKLLNAESTLDACWKCVDESYKFSSRFVFVFISFSYQCKRLPLDGIVTLIRIPEEILQRPKLAVQIVVDFYLNILRIDQWIINVNGIACIFR